MKRKLTMLLSVLLILTMIPALSAMAGPISQKELTPQYMAVTQVEPEDIPDTAVMLWSDSTTVPIVLYGGSEQRAAEWATLTGFAGIYYDQWSGVMFTVGAECSKKDAILKTISGTAMLTDRDDYNYGSWSYYFSNRVPNRVITTSGSTHQFPFVGTKLFMDFNYSVSCLNYSISNTNLWFRSDSFTIPF